MSEQRGMTEQRSIKVVVFSDVVDSTGRMFTDEASTVALIERDLRLFDQHITAAGGALIKNTGDGILATFPTTTQALDFIQNALQDLHRQGGVSLQHRFGLHIGEIYLKGDDIVGQGVHLAARLQTISPINGVAFTEGTHANIDPRFRHRAIPLGSLELKGLPGKIRCLALQESAFLATGDSDPLHPLRAQGNRLRQRLITSTPSQALACAALLLLALFVDLDPANPVSSYLLDRRLDVQKSWRNLTAQAGPERPALPVLLLESPEPLIPRSDLAELLERLPPERFPAVALDFVIDQTGPDPAAAARLVEVIRRQRRPSLTIGYFGAETDAQGAGKRSLPLEALRQAGVLPRDLATGTAAGRGPIKPPPLQVLTPLTEAHFATAIASGPPTVMPADAVIDWSLAWHRMIQVVSLNQLQATPHPLVLVGRFSDSDVPDPDLFRTPAAFYQPDPLWGGHAHEMPGVLVQAVVAQSLSLRHWLTPLSSFFCVALAAGGGVLLAALQPSRSRRLLLLSLILPAAGLLSLQVAITSKQLIPLALPTMALTSASLLRRQ